MSAEQTGTGPEQGTAIELPTPVKGITDEVLFELMADDATFRRETLSRLRTENPSLLDHIQLCLTSHEPNTSLNWTLAYYAIFSRSAERNGQPMLNVSKKTIVASGERGLADIGDPDNLKTNLRRAQKAMEQVERDQEIRITNEMNKSKELGKFWALVARAEALKTAATNHLTTELIFKPLYELGSFFSEQEGRNQVRQKFDGQRDK